MIPEAALERAVGAALFGQIGRGLDGVVADLLHGAIGKLDGLVGFVGQFQLVEGVLEAHKAHAYGAMTQVGVSRGLHAVIVVLDDVIEHAHGSVDRGLQLVGVKDTVLDMLRQVDRPQIADRDLLARLGVERDLGAQVGAVHDALVLLRAAQVARVLEREPRMARLEQHGQHLAPQSDGLDGLVVRDLAALSLALVGLVGFLEGTPGQIVQLGHVVGRKQGPGLVVQDTLDEQIRDPVRGVHVVAAPTIVAGVLAQVEKFLDVLVPGLEIGTDRALALAALVHGHGRVVDDLQERHHALALAVGALDMGAHGAYRRPVVAQTAGEFGQQRVVLHRLVDAVQIVIDRGQITARELRAQRARVEQRGRAAHEIERGEQLVELDGFFFALDLVDRQAHGHAHVERLRQLEAGGLVMDEVTIVERLQAQIGELQIAIGDQGVTQLLEVVLGQTRVQQLVVHRAMDIVGEVGGVLLAHLGVRGVLHLTVGQKRQRFMAELVHEQTRGRGAVVGLGFQALTGRQDESGGQLVFGDAVVGVFQRVVEHGLCVHAVDAFTGLGDHALQTVTIQLGRGAVLEADLDITGRGCGNVLAAFGGLGCALVGTLFTVEHVGAGHLVLARAHERQLDVVLDVFDMHSAAARQAAGDALNHLLGDVLHGLADARGGRPLLAFHVDEGLGDGQLDLGGIKGRDLAVTTDDLVRARLRGRQGRALTRLAAGVRNVFRALGYLCVCHVCSRDDEWRPVCLAL